MPPPAKKPRVDDPNPPKDAKENEEVSAKGATANGQAVSDASSSASSLSATAAQGAPPIAAPGSNAQAAAAPPVPVFGLLSMDTQQDRDTCLGNWVAKTTTYVEKSLLKFLSERQSKVAFQIPSSLLLIPPRFELMFAMGGIPLLVGETLALPIFKELGKLDPC